MINTFLEKSNAISNLNSNSNSTAHSLNLDSILLNANFIGFFLGHECVYFYIYFLWFEVSGVLFKI